MNKSMLELNRVGRRIGRRNSSNRQTHNEPSQVREPTTAQTHSPPAPPRTTHPGGPGERAGPLAQPRRRLHTPQRHAQNLPRRLPARTASPCVGRAGRRRRAPRRTRPHNHARGTLACPRPTRSRASPPTPSRQDPTISTQRTNGIRNKDLTISLLRAAQKPSPPPPPTPTLHNARSRLSSHGPVRHPDR